MIEKISALKNKAIERANYYTKIDFPNLANEFMELVNILNEMENIVKEREELKAQIQILENKIQMQADALDAAREESEEF